MQPKDFKHYPWSSVMQKIECETIAWNIMTILDRTGGEWRSLSWDEYKEEREKDGNFSVAEKPYFERVVGYCASPDKAGLFCKGWKDIANKAIV